eukprot:2424551-Rhodomonas_salina.1
MPRIARIQAPPYAHLSTPIRVSYWLHSRLSALDSVLRHARYAATTLLRRAVQREAHGAKSKRFTRLRYKGYTLAVQRVAQKGLIPPHRPRASPRPIRRPPAWKTRCLAAPYAYVSTGHCSRRQYHTRMVSTAHRVAHANTGSSIRYIAVLHTA